MARITSGVDHRDRSRGVEQWCVIEAAHRGGFTAVAGFILALDVNCRQFDFRRQAAANATTE
jgi:hypothetical protein